MRRKIDKSKIYHFWLWEIRVSLEPVRTGMLQDCFKRKNGDHKTGTSISSGWDNIHESSFSYMEESKQKEPDYCTIVIILFGQKATFFSKAYIVEDE